MTTIFDIILPSVALLVGIGLLFVGYDILKIHFKRKNLDHECTYSSDIEHRDNYGVFVEHGMAREKTNRGVVAESKKSKTFFRTLR